MARLAGTPQEGQGAAEPPPTDPLDVFRLSLGRALGLGKPVGIGKEPARVRRVVGGWLAQLGQEALLDVCLGAARLSNSGTPHTLSWWVGWLEAMPARRAAATGADGRHWSEWLTGEEREACKAERGALYPQLADAPIAVTQVQLGESGWSYPADLRALDARWRELVEGRRAGAAGGAGRNGAVAATGGVA